MDSYELRRIPRSLVPKLHLGTRLSPKLRFHHTAPVRSRYHVHEHDRAYFVTSTTVAWLPIFTAAARCESFRRFFRTPTEWGAYGG